MGKQHKCGYSAVKESSTTARSSKERGIKGISINLDLGRSDYVINDHVTQSHITDFHVTRWNHVTCSRFYHVPQL